MTDMGDRVMLTYSNVVSLSHPIHPHIPLWAGDPPVEFEPVADLQTDGYFLRRFAMGEHSSTHMNAPNSFFSDGIGIDRYDPASLIRSAVVIDMRQPCAENPDYCLSDRDIAAWEDKHTKIPANSVVLAFTGWQAKWQSPVDFLNLDEAGIPHFPGFGADVIQFLLAERAIAGIGIDTHGVDGGLDQTFACNRQVLARQGIVLECLTNLDQLPPVGITLVIAPLPLQQGSGSPATVFALF